MSGNKSATVKKGLIVEIDDEHLVLPVRRFYEVHRGGNDLPPLVPHAAAVIDQNSQRHRHILAPKQRQRLPDIVLKYLKVLLKQIRDQTIALVEHRRVQDDKLRVAAEHQPYIRAVAGLL